MTRPLHELVARFEDATLPREEWTHEAHLAAALWFCCEGEDAALSRMRAALQRYNAVTGLVDGPFSGYHETLTVFWIRAVASFASANPGELDEVFPRLLLEWSDVKAPLRYYSKRALMNPTARARFLEPDGRPFDF